MRLRQKIFVALSILLLLIISVVLLRQPLLEFALNKVKEKVKQRYNADLIIGNAGFEGLRDIYLENVILVPPTGDTLLTMKSFKASIRLGKLLKMKIGFKELAVDSVLVNMVKKDSLNNNYSFFFKTKKTAKDSSEALTSSVGFNDRFSSLYKALNDVFNENITIRSVKVIFHDREKEEMINIPELYFDGSLFQSSIITSSLEGVNLWLVKGNADADKGEYDFSVKRSRGASFALPFIDLIDGFKVCFDEAEIKMAADAAADVIPFKGDFKVKNLLVNHWRISPEDVLMPNLVFHLDAEVEKDKMQMQKGSQFTVNKLPINITASYSRKPENRIRFDAGFTTNNAQDLFASLPEGMFNTFKGFNAAGGLEYSLHFDLPKDNPDSLAFDSKMKGKNFRIINYGTENFSKMGAPFSFLAMDGERPIRSFVVGEGNPFFTPYNEISEYLKNAVLTSEDPSFFNHGGFVEEAFRESIITNIKQGRFARGGSTISMQLIKNVHLSRNKTVSRKLEEALIVWLVEQNRLVSKERMFEVYLNIIEWGPNVYGIGEASRFYFGKLPRELSLSESIYLSSLIPHPKYFRYSFDPTGNLKPFMANYFKLVSNRLVHREKITQAEADSLQPTVRLSGEALLIVLPPDTIPVDSLELEQIRIRE